MSTNTKPSIVFCHGLWADGSCFSKVIPTLQADGHEVIAVQYGLNNYADDVATVKRTLGRVNSPAILVGHSYGGATITGAGTDERVAGLVYIAAVVPDVQETVQSQLNKYPTEIFSQIEIAGGRIWIKPEGVKYFAGDLSEQEQKLVGRPTTRPLPTCSSSRSSTRLPGSRSRAGTSSLKRTKPCIPIFSAFWRSA
jgi:Predicted hydrolases or acyltransferases (alpha/beta hydrolase superfamily)